MKDWEFGTLGENHLAAMNSVAKRFTYTDADSITPGEYLSTLDALLTLDAAEWTETSSEAIRLLAEAETAPLPDGS